MENAIKMVRNMNTGREYHVGTAINTIVNKEYASAQMMGVDVIRDLLKKEVEENLNDYLRIYDYELIYKKGASM